MAITDKELSRALLITRAAFAFGAGSTMLINLAHAESGWGPKLASLIAPISILFVVEMLVHIPKPQHRGFTFLIRSMILLIGTAALAISYTHTAELLITYGEKPIMAWVTPIVPDGMMVVSSIGLALVMREREQRQEMRRRQEEDEAKRLADIEEAERLEAERERDHRRTMKEEAARREDLENQNYSEVLDTDADFPEDSEDSQIVVETSSDEDSTETNNGEVYQGRSRRRSATEAQVAAREEYKQSTLSGYPMTAAALGQKFGRGERWGEERIAEVRNPQTV